MATSRQIAGRNIVTRGTYTPAEPKKVTDVFGTHVFNDTVMKEKLPKDVYKTLTKTIEYGAPLDASIADVVAAAMKNWALEHGATHYTHWFQPLTGRTAEKHDAFIVPQIDGNVILQFSGKLLVQGEPDASSFPSGGIRETFEARGYTAWDPTSPAFIRITDLGATLCIPTAFCSYTGEALDKKTPILRSQAALNDAAVKVLGLIGTEADYVKPTVGLEQEYFLIDAEYAAQRPDIIATGRTLFGAPAYKGQALDDHYFGSIKPRVQNYMHDLEQALYKLGVPVTTRHNEVAPAQYELAPVFEYANQAVDHNMLVMEISQDLAVKHNLKCLLHEKPFAGLNGSGKHCNYSLSDSNGTNLLDPGKTPHDNLQFMVFLSAIIRGLDKYAKLLRSSVAHAGNDHRLGANEAPPAILSIFLGDELNAIVETLIAGNKPGAKDSGTIKLGNSALPELPKDSTDRNRTSPFAFTGNRFEFRALGSSQHVASPIFYLNTIIADSLTYVGEQIEAKIKAGATAIDAADAAVRETLAAHKRIIFNGNGYGEEWHAEAEKRGLANLKNTPEACAELCSKEHVELLSKYGVFTKGELEARYNIKVENYIGKLDIEFAATLDMASTMILPAAMQAQAEMANSVVQAEAAGLSISGQKATLAALSTNIETLVSGINAMTAKLDATPEASVQVHAEYFANEVIPAMEALREAGDALEAQVNDTLWPMPKYRELLWIS